MQGHVQAERLGGFEIERQYVLGRCLHWQVRRLLALEDAIDIASSATELVDVGAPYEINPPAAA